MKILRSWISDFIDIDELSNERLVELLTTRVAEVEETNDKLSSLENIFAAEIKTVKKHPESKKLNILSINNGSKDIEIVCADSSCKEGEIVAYASPGASIINTKDNSLIKIETRKVAGIESEGLLVSEAEIGLGPDNETVLRLSDDYLLGARSKITKLKVGAKFTKLFEDNDLLIEIDNKSLTHRPDLWGHYGFARELSALTGKKLKIDFDNYKFFKDIKNNFDVEIEEDSDCRRFSLISIDNIKNQKSPLWLRQRLARVDSGVRNLIVDLSNYVMRDIGQPNHTYDTSLLKENKFTIRKAKDKEEFVTLDDKELKLSKNDIVIADSKQVLALGGVIGGKSSSIADDTTSVIIESANFCPTTIRRSAKNNVVRTDASNRFEKSQSAESTPLAIERFSQLIKELCPSAEIGKFSADNYLTKQAEVKIAVDYEYIKQRLGVEIDDSKIDKIFSALGIEKEKSSWIIPQYRATRDLNIIDDLVEEVGRTIGYENIPESIPLIESKAVKITDDTQNQISLKLNGIGFSEIYNYSFTNPELSKELGYECSAGLGLKNPIDANLSCVRSSLVPSMISAINKNLKREELFALYEFGSAYTENKKQDNNCDETSYLCLGLTAPGKEKKELLNFKPAVTQGALFYSAISVLKSAVSSKIEVKQSEEVLPWMHPYRNADLVLDGKQIGRVAELMPNLVETKGIRVAIVEVDLDRLSEISNQDEVKFNSFSNYPDSFFEISVVMNEKEAFSNLEKIITSTVESELLKKLEVLSVYQGAPLADDEKSISVKMYLGSKDGTLSPEEVTKIQDSVMNSIDKSQYSLRQ